MANKLQIDFVIGGAVNTANSCILNRHECVFSLLSNWVPISVYFTTVLSLWGEPRSETRSCFNKACVYANTSVCTCVKKNCVCYYPLMTNSLLILHANTNNQLMDFRVHVWVCARSWPCLPVQWALVLSPESSFAVPPPPWVCRWVPASVLTLSQPPPADSTGRPPHHPNTQGGGDKAHARVSMLTLFHSNSQARLFVSTSTSWIGQVPHLTLLETHANMSKCTCEQAKLAPTPRQMFCALVGEMHHRNFTWCNVDIIFTGIFTVSNIANKRSESISQSEFHYRHSCEQRCLCVALFIS